MSRVTLYEVTTDEGIHVRFFSLFVMAQAYTNANGGTIRRVSREYAEAYESLASYCRDRVSANVAKGN